MHLIHHHLVHHLVCGVVLMTVNTLLYGIEIRMQLLTLLICFYQNIIRKSNNTVTVVQYTLLNQQTGIGYQLFSAVIVVLVAVLVALVLIT